MAAERTVHIVLIRIDRRSILLYCKRRWAVIFYERFDRMHSLLILPGLPMAQYVYTMSQVGKVVPPNRVILKDISLSFFPGAKIGVLGLNGSGKSSLLRIMAGVDKDYLGEARPQPDLNVGYLSQEPELDPDKDVRGNVEDGVRELSDALTEFNAISDRFAEPMSDDEMNDLLMKQGELQLKIDSMDGWDLDRKLEVAADALRLPAWDADVTNLSGGERRRVALCRLLLSNPDMLLLDEPTNHLDAESVGWLERYLKDFPGTVVAITHDRYFLDNAAGWILELDRGHGIPYEGNYSDWLDAKNQRLQVEEKREVSRQRSIKTELEWVKTQPKARHAKNKARLARFEELSSQEFQTRNETLELYIPPGPRLGDVVLEVEHLQKSFGDELLIEDLSFSVPRGAIVGIIGGNGAGKSTLFRMICGEQQPDKGNLRVGETVELGYVDQSRDSLSDDKNVWEEISEGNEILQIGRYQTQSRSYVSRFNFKGSDQQKLVRDLSGGERNRVHLAKLLKKGANVLLLDEPTNDLDVETLRALEDAIEAFPGTIMVISHDRWFLDRIATHMLAFEGDSQAVWFDGNYSEYEEDYRKRVGERGQTPTRVHYKKLAS
jgi:sulfate-transporting ATPase